MRPAVSISGSRAMPLPSLAFDDGLCEICVPVSRIRAISVSDSQTQCAAMQFAAEDAGVVGDLGGPPAEALLGVLDLGQRLVEVDVNAGAELVGERRASRSSSSDASGSHSIPT